MAVIFASKLYAEVVLARAIEQEALPSNKRILEQALSAFRSLGFNCMYYSGTSFSIDAEPSIYETVFSIKLIFDAAEPFSVRTDDGTLLEEFHTTALPADIQSNLIGIRFLTANFSW